MEPLDLSKAQVYQYTSGVPSARRFRSLASVAAKGKELPFTAQVLSTAAKVAPLPVKAAQKVVRPHAGVDRGLVTARGAGVQAEQTEQKPLVAKVSREWYVDAVVER